MSLCIHTKDGHIVTRNALHNMAMPEQTETYFPMTPGTFMDVVEQKVNDVGFEFGKEEHGLSHGDMRHFGVVEIIDPSNRTESEYAFLLAVRGSMDKRFPKMLGFGSRVFVCDNEAFIAQQVMARKHTQNMVRDLPLMVLEAVSKIADTKQRIAATYEAYQNTPMNDREAHDLLIRCLRANALITTKLERAVEEWYEPAQDHGEKTAWRLFNAITEASKGTRSHDLLPRTIELHKTFDEYVGFQYQMAA